MDIIATRGVFGDFGRVKKGDILKDVSKTLAEKMTKSGGYRIATADDIKAAEERKKKGVPNAKAAALAARKTANHGAKTDIDKIRADAAAEVDKIRTDAAAEIEKARASAEAVVSEAREEIEKAKAEIEAAKTDAAEQVAHAKADADAARAELAKIAKKD